MIEQVSAPGYYQDWKSSGYLNGDYVDSGNRTPNMGS